MAKPFRFNFAAIAIVPISVIGAKTAEAQIDALYDAVDGGLTRAKATPLLQLAAKMQRKLKAQQRGN